LLKAIRLPELITATQEQYENTAVALAVDAQRLAGIKRRLADNRLTAPLFDAKLFTRHLEQAYQQMVERYQRDLPPEHIHIAVDNS
jgi:predicted O-linked N-acetylglucosamine transferase (SPINDLY family)